MEKIYIIHESEFGQQDTCITTLAGNWEEAPEDIHFTRLEWCAKKCVNDGARYEFVSQSQFPPDWDNYSWDYTNCDGFGSSSFFTQSWDNYVSQSLEL